MKAGDILSFVASNIGIKVHDFPDGGFVFGGDSDQVNGILITWMATCEALKYAAEKGLNIVVCHEEAFFGEEKEGIAYRWTTEVVNPIKELCWHPDNKRRRIIEESGLTVLRIHYGLDRMCIFHEFAKAAGLGRIIVDSGYESVFALPEPVRVKDLAKSISARLNFPHIRVAGDLNRLVSKAGNLWGGVALLSNRYFMRKQIENGADVLIAGESEEMAMILAAEFDVPIIVTGHTISENIGLRCFAEMLKQKFPHIPVDFYEVKVPFVGLGELS